MTNDQILHVSDGESFAHRCEHLLQEISSTPRIPGVGEVRHLAGESERMCTFQDEARTHFQDLLARQGISSEKPVGLTVCIQPYWLRQDYPFVSCQSGAARSCSVGVAIIGGLWGALAA